ncbi:MAG: GNAT family N-acetyltransferase [Nitrosomonas sp.]|nr:GNAT family N-acetyltransferase [Nitrosomonas sp.]
MFSQQIHIVNWQDQAPVLRAIRESVFIHEQQVPVELEWDEFDEICLHILAMSPQGEPIGTARLLQDGYIGRMAVLKEWRGKGFGSAMMLRLLEESRNQGTKEVVLNAQTSAIGFYERFGFKVTGEEFIEAGIPHVRMILWLS